MVNMSKQTTQQGRDIFQVYERNFSKYFSEAEKAVPQYFQSVIGYQNQKSFLNTWKNAVDASIDVQRKYAQKGKHYLESYQKFSDFAESFGLEI